jgi:hypothetical protein
MEREEIAICVLALLWLVLGIASLEGASSEGAFLGRLAVGFVVLVAGTLIGISWHARYKTSHKHY